MKTLRQIELKDPKDLNMKGVNIVAIMEGDGIKSVVITDADGNAATITGVGNYSDKLKILVKAPPKATTVFVVTGTLLGIAHAQPFDNVCDAETYMFRANNNGDTYLKIEEKTVLISNDEAESKCPDEPF